MPTIEIDYAPFGYQQLLHDHPARFKIVVGGRRVGKSRMAMHELLRHCLSAPNRLGWWIGPTHAMAREVGFEEFRSVADTLQPAIQGINEALGRVRFRNGSQIYFKGADSERSLRGRGLTFCVVDEAAFCTEETWTRALMPALADRKGQALLVSTPNGRGNWLYGMYCYAMSPESRGLWAAWHWPTMMNPLMTPDELEMLRGSVSAIDYRQEFLAEFVSRGGYVYEDFCEENIVRSAPGERLSPSPHEYDIFLGIDFGFANPAAVCFMAVDRETDEVTQFDEIYRSHLPIEEIEAHILATLKRHDLRPEDVRHIYTDPAGNADELESGVSPVDYLRMSRYRWHVANKKSLIAPGLALVRGFIRTATGNRRFFVTSNCVETIRSLRGYSYDKRETSEIVKEEALKDGVHDHMADAIRYFFIGRFDQAKYVAYSPEQSDYSGKSQVRRVMFKRCNRCKRQYSSHTPKGVPPHLCRACLES
jgi:phage terminase large subunit